MLKKVALISANVTKGQGKPGTELGAKEVKQESLLEALRCLNWTPSDFAQVDDAKPAAEIKYKDVKNLASVAETTHKLSDVVEKAIKESSVPVILGGDHSLSIGSVHGTLKALNSDIGLIWIDAHADINTPLTSGSGNLHGQPLSFLVEGLEDYMPKISGFNWITSKISPKRIVYIGLRDVDTGELAIIKKFNIKSFSMSDIQQLGIQLVIEETLKYLTIDNELLPLHVSVDIDSLDPWFAPSTGTPVLGGLNLRELMLIGNRINETGKLRTLDLVEVNPLIKSCDYDVKKTVFSAIRTVLSFFGFTTIGTLAKDYEIPRP